MEVVPIAGLVRGSVRTVQHPATARHWCWIYHRSLLTDQTLLSLRIAMQLVVSAEESVVEAK